MKPLPWKPLRSHEDSSGPMFDIEPSERAEYDAKPFVKIEAADGSTVCTAHDLFEFAPGVAEQIVRAVNSHDALVQALTDLMAWAEQTGGWDAPCWDRARAALALANGGAP